MACAGAITATILTAGAGLAGGIGGNPLASISGIPNSITDSVTGLTSSVNMSTMTSLTSSVSSLPNMSALTSTVSGITGGLPAGLQSSFSNMASGLGDNVFSAGFDVFSGDALGVMGAASGISSVLPTGLADAAKTMGGSLSGANILGDASKFGSILGAAEGFVGSSNQMISAATNAAGSFAGGTFPGMDSISTGGLSGITNALPDFGTDLGSLGSTIDFASISDLGSPGQLLKNMDVAGSLGPMYDKVANIKIDPRLAGSLGGSLSSVTNAIANKTGGLSIGDLGISSSDIAQLGPALPNNIQGQVFDAFNELNTAELGDVKGILKNTQSAIVSGGDLMNPQKLFPTSFSTLTAPLRTASVGDRAIYSASGAVNAEFDSLGTPLVGALPEDLAVANGALARSFGQVKGIESTNNTTLTTAATNLETLKDLPLVKDQTVYVEPAVITYWTSQYSVQDNIQLATGPDGTYQLSDVIGYAAGYNSVAPLQQNQILLQELIDSGALNVFYAAGTSSSSSTGILIIMDYFVAGAYDPIAPLTDYIIPAGVYGAGTYATQELAWNAIIAAAKTLMQTFYNDYTQAQTIQRNFKRLQEQQAREKLIRAKIDLDLDTVPANTNNAIQLAANLPNYALDTSAGGSAELLERVMNFDSTGGQASVAAMREARNIDKLADANIVQDGPIPITPPANPGSLSSATYTVAEADAIIIRN
jgi:hypothetical protein